MADKKKQSGVSEEKSAAQKKRKLKSEAEKKAAGRRKLAFDREDVPLKTDVPKGNKPVGSARKPVVSAATGLVHRKVEKSNQDDNAAVEAANASTATTETGAGMLRDAVHSKKLKSSENAEKYQERAGSGSAGAGYGSTGTASARQTSAQAEKTSGAVSRHQQRKAIQREYASAKRSEQAASKSGSGIVKSFGQKLTRFKERAVSVITEHPYLIVIVGVLVLLFLILCSSLSSCSALMPNGSGAVVASTFTAKDTDIIGANNDYKELEAALEAKIGRTETDKPGYDEYQYELDQIGHDPYKLAAYLTILYEDYSRKEVQSTLKQLFEKQYVLTYHVKNETRYRTETRQGIREQTVISAEKEETIEVPYEYQVQVSYTYRTLTVSLKNEGLAYAISQVGALTDDQQERMAILAETKGNKADLFKDDAYVAASTVSDYQIPAEYLTNARFARMITEAEKYLGYPYVWGGSSPDTSFDCSGFVSWVINHCGNGWSVGRQTAEGLRSQCVTIISASEAKPGDLIFFQGTYNTTGASHVGIYVGDNMMLHCGNPIQYASIDTPYMQEHFYCFGRIKD